jgi:Family of unknown function (DUF6062)
VTGGDAARPSLPARDLGDVRLSDAMTAGGCPICRVRARSERGTLDAIIAERVLDIGFRRGLERDHAFCRRHVAELVEADRASGSILGASILYGAIVTRRTTALKEALAGRGRARRNRLSAAGRRPPCQACDQGANAVSAALDRLVERAVDPAWAAATSEAPFCLDDLVRLLAAAGDETAMQPIIDRQLARLDDLAHRLDGYAHHSAQDRRHLMTDGERSAADEAARLLGGTPARS